jgi:3-dehydro-4-phosphotetronate decarboxylase
MSMADEAALRQQICEVGRSLFERGYVHATAGNISVRLDDGFLITPTDACLGRLDPARLARLDAQGQQTGGDRASKTLALHRRIYDADPEARCVIHTHSTHLVALTLQGVWSSDDILPPITPYFVMKVGHVPLMPYHRPATPPWPSSCPAHRRDGACGRSATARGDDGPAGSQRLACIARRSQCRAGRAGRDSAPVAELPARPEPLSDAAIDELRRHFGARW